MLSIAEQHRPVTGGVDTHSEIHVAAVVDQVGRVLGSETFAATEAGYRAALAWMRAHGQLESVGVEGTGSYGTGLARYLTSHDVAVVEVICPNRQARRRRGKSDTADAVAAALAALNGEASGIPKAHDGAVESIRALRVARRGAVKAATQASNQLRDLIVTAPEPLRAKLVSLSTSARVALAARFRPGELTDPVGATKQAMAGLARRYQRLQARDHRPGRRARDTRRPGRSRPLRRQPRCWIASRRHAADHARGQPRPPTQRSELRRAVRRQPGGRLLG